MEHAGEESPNVEPNVRSTRLWPSWSTPDGNPSVEPPSVRSARLWLSWCTPDLCREDLGKTLDLLDAQKLKFATSQLLLEEARRSVAESRAALSDAEARLDEVRADRKVFCESNLELKEQVKSCKSELEFEHEAEATK